MLHRGGFCYLTLKEAGGVQNDPMGFRLAAISHRIMLWSQKFLTLSIYIPSRRSLFNIYRHVIGML